MATLRSYLIGATYDWIIAHNLTPYLLVDALVEGVNVPGKHTKNGRILLNASPASAQAIEIGTCTIEFDVTFSGKPWHIIVPIDSILAIYARETNQGLFSQSNESGLLVNEGDDEFRDPDPQESIASTSAKTKKKTIAITT